MQFYKFFVSLLAYMMFMTIVVAEQYNLSSFNQHTVKTHFVSLVEKQLQHLEGLTVDVSIMNPDIFQKFPEDVLYIYVDYAKPDTYLGKLMLDVSFLTADNQLVVQKKLLVKSSVHGDVYVASRKLAPSHIITEDDLVIKSVEITDLNQGILFNKNNILGKQTTKKMSQGLTFTEKWVEITPVISKGDVVKVIVSSVGFELRYDAVALQSGMIGDVIRLKTDNKKIVSGEVANEKSVVVIVN